MAASRFERPATPPGFDSSRASERGADPRGWRYPEASRQAVYDVIAARRDIRRFRPDEVSDELLCRVLAAAHQAPSVGLMQPWRFIVVRAPETRMAVRSLAQRERLRQADRFDQRSRQFLDQKIEGVVEAPVGICVCCDHGDSGAEILGRGTIPETDVYSTACAIENLWLAARAEGLGVGWVSFYEPGDMRGLLGLPERVDPLAYLCLGWPDERPVRPGLESAGWSARMALDEVVMPERWSEPSGAPPGSARSAGPARFAPDRRAQIASRDRLDELVKPAGSLGALEALIERWAQITGEPPPAHPRAAVLVCAADHGHLVHGTSLFDADVSARVTAAAARGETAAAVLCRDGGHELLIADLGLVADTPEGARDVKAGRGTADMTRGPAMSAAQLQAALATGARLAGELAGRGIDCLVLGEVGMGNTATAAALTCVLTGTSSAQAVGRGTGLDAEGLARKRDTVDRALRRHPPPVEGHAALAAVGGFELAALAGALSGAAEHRLPVILDGYAVCTAALAAVRADPSLAELLIAGHRSAEPGHVIVLTELGLEPLLDLRLRLGEASGALLALPLVAAAGRLYRGMGTFAEAGIAHRH
jgi:nicotinate-nucleotide--dimethylbenzimidazole phosphoribosyltransferase